jgi:hypothetical protein
MSNRLLQEMSPYLQQHADNPVDWYAWNDDTTRCAARVSKTNLCPPTSPRGFAGAHNACRRLLRWMTCVM